MTRYQVTAATGFGRRGFGDLFEADLDPALEARALARGSLTIVDPDDQPAEAEEAGDA